MNIRLSREVFWAGNWSSVCHCMLFINGMSCHTFLLALWIYMWVASDITVIVRYSCTSIKLNILNLISLLVCTRMLALVFSECVYCMILAFLLIISKLVVGYNSPNNDHYSMANLPKSGYLKTIVRLTYQFVGCDIVSLC